MRRNMTAVWLLILGFAAVVHGQAGVVEYIAQNFQPKFSVINNWVDPVNIRFDSQLELTNTGNTEVLHGDWEMFVCHIRLFEPDILTPNLTEGIPLGSLNMELYHINGCLYKLKPTSEFRLQAGGVVRTTVRSSDWMVARTDVMPNWYVSTEDGATVQTIVYTEGEEIKHVGEFTQPEQYKRMEGDKFSPLTAQYRYSEFPAGNPGYVPRRLVPNPLNSTINWDDPSGAISWTIVATSSLAQGAALFLQNATGWPVADTPPGEDFVQFVEGDPFTGTACENNTDEAYHIDITHSRAIITAQTEAGMFYAVQTLLGMLYMRENLPNNVYPGEILDCPRFPFRGFMLDVGRNFMTKDTVLDMLHVMATYKLNKFHFHLTEDEGWRLQIPDLPELTEIGGEQCHNLAEDECIIPQLGSDPNWNNRTYYTRAEYMEILKEAQRLHIEVIPEFDMPGHAHAAIKAMEARFHNLSASGDPDAAKEYLLSDLNDTSQYYSAQHFWDSALNPCLTSTYTFLTKLIQEVHWMHHEAGVPLLHYHFGGDEVPGDAWKGSPVCQELSDRLGFDGNADIKRYFFDTVVNASYAVNESLALGSWEDGIMDTACTPFPTVQNVSVYTNCWSNVWEWGHGERAYKFANNDYKVVLSHATHLYFDHPQEPDPYERGYYWATRVTAAEKTFGYMPDDIYANIDIDRMGNPITEEDVCPGGCVPLQEDKRHNILGMQGHLWSETTRSQDILHDMVLPRLLALAERAWHKADWESLTGTDRDTARREDWEDFAEFLGRHELIRLGRIYHLRPPGASVSNDELNLRSEFPGQGLEYNTDNGAWQTYSSPVQLSSFSNVFARTKSADGRYSREVLVTSRVSGAGSIRPFIGLLLVSLAAILFSGTP